VFYRRFLAVAKAVVELWLYFLLLHFKFNLLSSKKALNSGQRVLLIVSRNRTWIEFFLYYTLVYVKLGAHVVLLVDKKSIQRAYGLNVQGANRIFWFFFNGLLSLVPRLKCEFIDEKEDSTEPLYEQILEDWKTAAVSYDYHIEEYDVIKNSHNYTVEFNEFQRLSRIHLANLQRVVSNSRFDLILSYSGFISESRILYEWGKLSSEYSGNRIVFIDGWPWRPGNIVFAFGKPALDYSVRGLLISDYWTESRRTAYENYIELINTGIRSKSVSNFYRIQKSDLTSKMDKTLHDFLNKEGSMAILATNVNGDSSLVRRERFFKSQKEWLSSVINWYANEGNEFKLLIRIHPGETWAGDKCTDKVGDFLKYLKLPENVYVISSNDVVNTFQFAERAFLALTWISNVGAEFVSRGISCLDAGISKFDELSITPVYNNVQEYFGLVDSYHRRKTVPTPKQVDLAKRYVYFIFHELSRPGFGFNYNMKSTLKLSNNTFKEHMILAHSFLKKGDEE
jgi:hypothetical protein